MLFDPERHVPVTLDPLDDAGLASSIRELVVPMLRERLPDGTWPVHPLDDEGRELHPMHNVYFGAAGVVWTLRELAARGHLPEVDLDPHAHVAAFPGLSDPPEPWWFTGRSGVRAVALEARWDDGVADALARDIALNAHHPSREVFVGAPGTMLASRFVARFAPDPARWRALWEADAARLLEQRGPDGLWEQDLYGRKRTMLGAGHGFAGNVASLLAGREWLAPDVLADVVASATDVLERHAVHEEGRVYWWPEIDVPDGKLPLVQWCHGAPGMVTSFRRAPREARLDGLLVGAGEAIWAAGPVTKGGGLCHGTAGNGMAFLVLHERTGDARWIERARVFAAHAVEQVHAHRDEHELCRTSLFTGDAGVAWFLSCILEQDATFPLVDVA
ncbi:MAG: LanC-like protein [Alphaproteobacteria bacterium]|nr:LanC-like protein [Alphaproteobacteria bacterium]MCB9694612.1 LanC-like protein [Alphaproteobacteria bacterium]